MYGILDSTEGLIHIAKSNLTHQSPKMSAMKAKDGLNGTTY